MRAWPLNLMQIKYRTYSEEQLLVLLRQQDRKAFAEIYSRHFDLLYTQAMAILKEEELASDVIQDVFTYLWEHADIVIKTSLKAYLSSVTRHAVLKVIRRGKIADRFRAYVQQEMQPNDQDTETQTLSKEVEQLIDAEINRLPPRMREVFEMSYRTDSSNQEIAVSLGISPNTVKNHLVSSKRILRKRIEKLLIFLIHFQLLIIFF